MSQTPENPDLYTADLLPLDAKAQRQAAATALVDGICEEVLARLDLLAESLPLDQRRDVLDKLASRIEYGLTLLDKEEQADTQEALRALREGEEE